MAKAFHLIKRLAADEHGMAIMEYTILIGTMVVAVIVMISALGGWISTQWQTVCTSFKGSAC